MQRAIDETNRRRELQMAYNAEHGITPETIRKAIRRGIEEEIQARKIEREAAGQSETQYVTQEYIAELEAEMLAAAESLEFERAAQLRDRIQELQRKMGQKITVHAETDGEKEPRGRGRKGKGRHSGRQRVPRPQRPE
jgi:excinuclease ABC subunit B